jgi:hypothetical protein
LSVLEPKNVINFIPPNLHFSRKLLNIKLLCKLILVGIGIAHIRNNKRILESILPIKPNHE